MFYLFWGLLMVVTNGYYMVSIILSFLGVTNGYYLLSTWLCAKKNVATRFWSQKNSVIDMWTTQNPNHGTPESGEVGGPNHGTYQVNHGEPIFSRSCGSNIMLYNLTPLIWNTPQYQPWFYCRGWNHISLKDHLIMGVSTIKGKRFLILFLGKGPNHPILSPSGEWNVSRCQLASGHKPPAPSLRACPGSARLWLRSRKAWTRAVAAQPQAPVGPCGDGSSCLWKTYYPLVN